MPLTKNSYTIIESGRRKEDAGCYFGGVPWETFSQWEDVGLDRKHCVTIGVNSVLLEWNKQLVLIDSGSGDMTYNTQFMAISPNHGDGSINRQDRSSDKLKREIRKQGYMQSEIGTILITSLDPDHWGGLLYLNRLGGLTSIFPKAKIIMPAPAPQVAAMLTEASIKWESPGESDGTISPGLDVAQSPQGQLAIKVQVGGERLMIMGDICPTHWHMEQECNPATDRERGKTLATKRALLEEALQEGYLVVFSHGMIVKSGYLSRRDNQLYIR